MEYLLFLQQLRESTPSIINEAILFVSEFMGGTGALAVIALVYWCISKHAGSFMLLNFSSAYMMNQTLKNIFCVSRPFLRDSRLHPYTEATGYSFPSGHTMLGTAVYSSAAIWQKNRKWFVGVCIVLTLLTAFGRNWVGVHTPQDVIVGILVSLTVVFAQLRMLRWLDKMPGKDILVLIFSVLWAAVLLIFIPASEKTCGIFLGVYIGWFIERRWVRFEVSGKLLHRICQYILGMGLVLVVYKVLTPILVKPFSENLQTLLINLFTFLTVTALYPALLRLVQKKK
ncbi:MAG: phosphatase PAP2 family protein [Oscillospiraceae bacterium]